MTWNRDISATPVSLCKTGVHLHARQVGTFSIPGNTYGIVRIIIVRRALCRSMNILVHSLIQSQAKGARTGPVAWRKGLTMKNSLKRSPKANLVMAFLLVSACLVATAEDQVQAPAVTEELPTELRIFESMPMVITAARKPQRITEASSTIDVFTEQDIRNSGALTLAELLERLPGIYTPRAHNGQDMLWIRGVGGRYNDNALLLIDGVPYRTLYYSHFPINEQIPLQNIKKVEVIRGPGSALYGTGAFSGVINIITKSAVDIKDNEVGVGFGTWDTQNHHAMLRKEFEEGEITFFANYLDSRGYRAERDDEGVPSDLRREPESQFYKLKMSLFEMDFNFHYSRFQMNDFTAAKDEDDEGGRETSDHFSAQVSYNSELHPNHSLQMRAYFNSYELERYGVAVDEDFVVTSLSKTRQDGRVAGLDMLLTSELSTDHSLLMGLNYEYEFLDHVSSSVCETPCDEWELSEWASQSGGEESESIHNNNIGFYVEDELKLGQQWILTSGLRFDSFEASDSSWSPRVSAVYTPNHKTAVKVRYGEAFRAPTYQELYRQTEEEEGEGSTQLNPQTIRTAEFEVSRFVGDNHRVNATAFYSEFDEFIKVIGDGDFENLEQRKFHGVEVGLQGSLVSDLSYFANYSLTRAEEFDGTDVASVPEHMGNIGVTYSGLKFVEISPHLRLVGDRNRPLNYQEDFPEGNEAEFLDGYALFNVTLVCRNLPGGMKASLSFRNLFDEEYHTSGEQTEDYDVLGAGRRVTFSVSKLF